MRIVTDSRLPGEAKDPDSSSLFTIFRAFATEAEAGAFHQALLDGIGWGEAKQVLFERIEADVAPMRERYDARIWAPTAGKVSSTVGPTLTFSGDLAARMRMANAR